MAPGTTTEYGKIGHINALLTQVDTALPFFEADADASLENSILGSVIPGLDPDPPVDPQIASLSSNSFAPHANSAAPRLGSEEPDPSSLSATKSDSSSDPARQGKGSEGPREWAGGGGGAGSAARGGHFEAGLSPLVGQGLGGGGGVGEELARNTRLHPVKHGLRVLLRGTSRCVRDGGCMYPGGMYSSPEAREVPVN